MQKQKSSEEIVMQDMRLMKSTDPEIADYDVCMEKVLTLKLLGKLKNTYADASAAEVKKVVDPKSSIIPSKAKTFEGGEIKEGSGDNIKGETADRQLIKENLVNMFSKNLFQTWWSDQLDKVVANTVQILLPLRWEQRVLN